MLLSTETKKPYFDPKFQMMAVNVLPGEFMAVKEEDMMLVTILGSCVAACIRDPLINIGGLNHFLLAEPNVEITSHSSRYGCFAMECLINELLKQGAQKSRMEAKIFGGSNLFNSRMHIGLKNAEFVKEYLRKEGIQTIAEDLGGITPRKIHYWPHSGKTMRLLIKPDKTIEERETSYKSKLKNEGSDGGIELF